MTGFRVIVIAVAPAAGLGSMVADICRGICVKEPERYIDTFDLVNVVFLLEHLWKKELAVKVFGKACFGCLFVQLKGNNEVWTESTGKLAGHDHRISTEGAAGCTGAFICNDLAAAGLAYVDGHAAGFVFLPGVVRGIFPAIVIGLLFSCGFVKLFDGFHIKFSVAVRAFHLLKLTVEFNGSTAAGAFIFK